MNIVVCVKQVPATQKVAVDPETGVLLRSGIATKMNPYDLVAMQAAKEIAKKTGATIHAVTMGPDSATEVLRESFALGAHEAWLISDRRFAGADVLATAYTIATAIKSIGEVDLIICGKQTTDGDTAQVGPEMAEVLDLPHVSWAKELIDFDEKGITIRQDMTSFDAIVELPYPCLMTVETTMFQADLPSYRLMKETKDRPIHIITADDIDIDAERIGLSGSPTQVERIYEPETSNETITLTGDASKVADELIDILKAARLFEVRS